MRVLRGNGTGDIVDQYVRFCKILDEEQKKYGRSKKTIEEILRWCIEENVLSPFLVTRQKEVAEIMVTLFDQEKVTEIHDYHIAEAARKDGILEGRAESRIEGILASIQSLMASMGLTLDQAMNALSISEEDRSTCRGLMENRN